MHSFFAERYVHLPEYTEDERPGWHQMSHSYTFHRKRSYEYSEYLQDYGSFALCSAIVIIVEEISTA